MKKLVVLSLLPCGAFGTNIKTSDEATSTLLSLKEQAIDAILASPSPLTKENALEPFAQTKVPNSRLPPKEIESKSHYHLFNPTPDSILRDLSPDRPDATESPITVDAGRFAIEASLFDWRRDGGTDTYTFGQLNFKTGLTQNIDFQTVVDLYSEGEEPGEGFGDVTLRLKWNLWGNDGGDTALALMPFVKIPTGTELSNDEWEGGLIIPFSIELSETVGLGLMAEFDYVAEGKNHDFEFLHTAVLGFSLTERTGAYLEYIGIAGEDAYEAYLAGGMNYQVNQHLILDFGLQGGLNNDSEDFGFFTGFTKRF